MDVDQDRAPGPHRPTFTKCMATIDRPLLTACRSVGQFIAQTEEKSPLALGGCETLNRTMSSAADTSAGSSFHSEVSLDANAAMESKVCQKTTSSVTPAVDNSQLYVKKTGSGRRVSPVVVGFHEPTVVRLIMELKDLILACRVLKMLMVLRSYWNEPPRALTRDLGSLSPWPCSLANGQLPKRRRASYVSQNRASASRLPARLDRRHRPASYGMLSGGCKPSSVDVVTWKTTC